MKEKANLFSMLPKVDEMLLDSKINEILERVPRKIVVDSIREEIEILRVDIKEEKLSKDEIKERVESMPEIIKKRIVEKNSFKLRRVINATGVIIHTNLGRSIINENVMNNIFNIATNYSNLEYDLDSGKRGSRYSHLEEIITAITGAESAMVVNNNAAAVMLVLSTLAKGKEVIVSRGELVEIGGSFRIPEVMEQSGAMLVDVGTTNKTHIWDYEKAINENTAVLLKVHTSNYRILGFTSTVPIEELSELKLKYNVPLVEDLGSGVLIDLSKFGLEYEPTVQDSVKKGVDVVTFSGDKLLGGPQAGIIIGKKEYIEKMKKNPLNRAFRIDKFTISALEGTLRLYLNEKTAIENIPTLKMLTEPLENLRIRAELLVDKLSKMTATVHISTEIVDEFSQVGGGSLPLEKIPTKCVTIALDHISITEFEKNLRKFRIPIITRVYKDKVYFDMRTIKDVEVDLICEGIEYAINNIEGVF